MGEEWSFIEDKKKDYSGWAIGASFVFGSDTFINSADGFGFESDFIDDLTRHPEIW